MKKTLILLAAAALFIAVTAGNAVAYGHGKDKGGKMDLEKKFGWKAKFILSKKDELGLTDKQYADIKALKHKTRKDLIMKNAEIEIVALEVKAEMWNEKADKKTVNGLIDKKYDLKKEKAKALAGACIDLKGILTKDQKAKMKTLMKECRKKMKDKPMMAGKKCRMKKGMMGAGMAD